MINDNEVINDTPKKKGSKRPYVVAIVLALALVVTITATSYAWFTANVTSGTINNTTVTTGTMNIEFTDGSEVGIENALPGQYVEKTFSVKNVGTLDTIYDIYLSDLINTFKDKTDLVYTLTSSDGGENVSETVVPASASKIVSDKAIAVGDTHTYTLRVDFKETNDNQDDNKGKRFSSIIRINEVIKVSNYEVVSGDVNTVGSVIKIADEEFYVIGQQDDTHVKLLSKWNLNIGSNPHGTATNLQDELVRGEASGYTTYGTVAYAGSITWGNGGHASSNQYVDNYAEYLNDQGANVTGRLIYTSELNSLGCNIGNNTCSGAPSWVYQTSYWCDEALGWRSDRIFLVLATGYVGTENYYSTGSLGIRPVIILEK